MKTDSLAFTMVQNDVVILELWLKYYARFFDRLYVICNRTRENRQDDIKNLCEKYNAEYEIFHGSLGDSDQTLGVVKERQAMFLETCRWVLYTDCDEIVIADPRKGYKNIREFMKRYKGNKTHCVCFDVMQSEDERAIDYSLPYLSQRSYWAKNNTYNKPLLSKVALDWNPGLHKEREMSDDESKSLENMGLILIHLKYSDMSPIGDRDLGPTITSYAGDRIAENMKNREKIPDIIGKIF